MTLLTTLNHCFQSTFYRNEPVGELCTFCPDGASCQSATYNEPISIQKWFIQDLDISGGRDALCENGPTDKDCPTDLISRRERRDYDRALQTLGNGERVCPSERLFDAIEDSQLMQDYPWVHVVYFQTTLAQCNWIQWDM